jgi:UPF0755 protein
LPNSKKILKRVVLGLLVAFVLAGAGIAIWVYRDLHTPVAHSHAADYIVIPRKSSTDSMLKTLAGEGILRRTWPLRLYIKLSGAGPKLRAGEYRFPTPISPLGVLRKLQEGEQRLSRFTVIEGWTRWDIAASLAHIPELKLTDTAAALALMDDVENIKDIDPAATNLEGYLFPATYSFPPDTKAAAIIATMVNRFRQEWRPNYTEKARAMNMTPRQIVTIASLVETEAKLDEDRPLIASVIYNRLEKHIPLGIDSAVIYASKLAGKWKDDGRVYQSDLDRRSPYNTRMVTGLPPGPVASPGASSIAAALNPATSDYLYYVREPSRNDGKHNFYSKEIDFQRGVAALRKWERENPR